MSLHRVVSQREGEKRGDDRREKIIVKQPSPAPTASTVGPCPTIIQISRTGPESFPSTIAPADHSFSREDWTEHVQSLFLSKTCASSEVYQIFLRYKCGWSGGAMVLGKLAVPAVLQVFFFFFFFGGGGGGGCNGAG